MALVGGIIGLPIPDETLLTFVGYYIYQGKMNFLIALLSAWLGSAVGISLSYILGKRLGLPFLKKFGPKMHITESKIARTQTLFQKIGPPLLIFGYFIPGVRHVTAYLTGISSLRIRTFCLYAYLGALIWSFTFIQLGLLFGKDWHLINHYVHRYGLVLLVILIVLAALAALAFLYIRRKKTNATH
ncbi:DedA family protein [Bacillus cytotoxicus]|uniref:DedA family protein n=1 Tax=Bacillus cytotoxicus TaxID=580165 RepID=A0ACC6A6X7_9BACI|nr:DedA family protein [Bacillus cytotoxicus]